MLLHIVGIADFKFNSVAVYLVLQIVWSWNKGQSNAINTGTEGSKESVGSKRVMFLTSEKHFLLEQYTKEIMEHCQI